MDTIKHLENKYSLARYELIRQCDGDEMRFYLYLKLYAINKHEAFPTYSTIKKDLGFDNKKISRIIKKMVKLGRLKIGKKESKIKGVKQAINIYDITWYDILNNKGITKGGSGKMEGGSGILELPNLSIQGSGKMEHKQVVTNNILTTTPVNKLTLPTERRFIPTGDPPPYSYQETPPVIPHSQESINHEGLQKYQSLKRLLKEI